MQGWIHRKGRQTHRIKVWSQQYSDRNSCRWRIQEGATTLGKQKCEYKTAPTLVQGRIHSIGGSRGVQGTHANPSSQPKTIHVCAVFGTNGQNNRLATPVAILLGNTGSTTGEIGRKISSVRGCSIDNLSRSLQQLLWRFKTKTKISWSTET